MYLQTEDYYIGILLVGRPSLSIFLFPSLGSLHGHTSYESEWATTNTDDTQLVYFNTHRTQTEGREIGLSGAVVGQTNIMWTNSQRTIRVTHKKHEWMRIMAYLGNCSIIVFSIITIRKILITWSTSLLWTPMIIAVPFREPIKEERICFLAPDTQYIILGLSHLN